MAVNPAANAITLEVASTLWLFLPPRHRRPRFSVTADPSSSLGHVVQAVGVPLTETGRLQRNGVEVLVGCRSTGGDVIAVEPVVRPQLVPGWGGRFLLDVHLGALARRLRLLGLDASWPDEAGDAALVEQANAERRLLLSQDRGLLKRRTLWAGAFVRGSRPDDQLADVLDRFDPVLAPWTRCTACNGEIEAVERAEVADRLEPGTLRTQAGFGRCRSCGRVYWRGAHARRLERIVALATLPHG